MHGLYEMRNNTFIDAGKILCQANIPLVTTVIREDYTENIVSVVRQGVKLHNIVGGVPKRRHYWMRSVLRRTRHPVQGLRQIRSLQSW